MVGCANVSHSDIDSSEILDTSEHYGGRVNLLHRIGYVCRDGIQNRVEISPIKGAELLPLIRERKSPQEQTEVGSSEQSRDPLHGYMGDQIERLGGANPVEE